jgi:hypothetical protein
LGITAVAAGGILQRLGYRSDEHVTDSAAAAGCVVRRWDGYAINDDWHLDRAVAAIMSAAAVPGEPAVADALATAIGRQEGREPSQIIRPGLRCVARYQLEATEPSASLPRVNARVDPPRRASGFNPVDEPWLTAIITRWRSKVLRRAADNILLEAQVVLALAPRQLGWRGSPWMKHTPYARDRNEL